MGLQRSWINFNYQNLASQLKPGGTPGPRRRAQCNCAGCIGLVLPLVTTLPTNICFFQLMYQTYQKDKPELSFSYIWSVPTLHCTDTKKKLNQNKYINKCKIVPFEILLLQFHNHFNTYKNWGFPDAGSHKKLLGQSVGSIKDLYLSERAKLSMWPDSPIFIRVTSVSLM